MHLVESFLIFVKDETVLFTTCAGNIYIGIMERLQFWNGRREEMYCYTVSNSIILKQGVVNGDDGDNGKGEPILLHCVPLTNTVLYVL